jgi:membrane protein required for colicin V production
MTLFDIGILATISLSSLFGFYKGMIRFIIGILGFFAAIVSAYFLYPLVVDVMSEYLKGDILIMVSSSAISYIISIIFIYFINSKILSSANDISGGVVDRVSGLFLGIVRGITLSIGTYIMLNVFLSGAYQENNLYELTNKLYSFQKPKWIIHSESAIYCELITKKLIASVPKETLLSIELKLPSYQLKNEQPEQIKPEESQNLQNELKELLK